MTNCRNCAAPLPDPAAVAAGACPSCGTLFGARAEIEEYAQAVLAGRPEVQRPPGLPPDMKVRWDPRGPDPAAGELTLTIRYLRPIVIVPFTFGLVALAALVYGWHLALEAQRWWVAVLASPLVGIYAWVRVTSVFDRLFVRVADGVVVVQQRRFWPKIETRLRIDEIRQLFATHGGNAYHVCARKADGKVVPLVKNLRTPQLAVYFERQLEQVSRIADQAEANELARNAPLPKPSSRVRALVVDAVFMAVILGVPMLLLTMCGSELGELAVKDEPSEIAFDVERGGRVYFTSEIDLVDNDWLYREDIPRSFSYRIQILKAGKPFAELHCDPFDVFVWVSGSNNKYIDSFWGPMERCAVQVSEPGTYTLRAWRSWKPGMPRIRLEESNLAPRQN